MAVDVGAGTRGDLRGGVEGGVTDSRPIRGAFTFSVGEPSATIPGLVDQVLAGDDTSSSSNDWVTVGRWLSYIGVAVTGRRIRRADLARPSPRRSSRRSRLTIFVAANIGVIGTAIMLGAQASIVSGIWLDQDGWATVIESHAGRWWVARLVMLALVPVLLVVARPFLDGRGVHDCRRRVRVRTSAGRSGWRSRNQRTCGRTRLHRDCRPSGGYVVVGGRCHRAGPRRRTIRHRGDSGPLLTRRAGFGRSARSDRHDQRVAPARHPGHDHRLHIRHLAHRQASDRRRRDRRGGTESIRGCDTERVDCAHRWSSSRSA